eukprot:2640861-Amphidinium_carterae.1
MKSLRSVKGSNITQPLYRPYHRLQPSWHRSDMATLSCWNSSKVLAIQLGHTLSRQTCLCTPNSFEHSWQARSNFLIYVSRGLKGHSLHSVHSQTPSLPSPLRVHSRRCP